MLSMLIIVGMLLVGVFVSQYALGMYLRLKRVFMPLTEEIRPQVHNAENMKKLETKQKSERMMSLGIFLFMPFIVLVYAGQWWHLAPYFIGVIVGAVMLRGKCNRNDNNLYLYFYTYRFYLENELALRDDPAYSEYMAYRRSSLVEQALDAEEKKHRQEPSATEEK